MEKIAALTPVVWIDILGMQESRAEIPGIHQPSELVLQLSLGRVLPHGWAREGREEPSQPQEQYEDTENLLQSLPIFFPLPLQKYNILSVWEQFKLVHFTQ